MGKQWVDITTIDNNTPFTKVRWKRQFAGSQFDAWFAEAPGIVSDGMSWFSGTAEYGWFSAHRMNNGWNNSYVYCCSFIHSGSGYWDVSGIDYGVSVKDAERNQYYDNVVTISGETYYEIDFSLWSGATGVNLYAPYSTMPWTAGDIFVEVGTDPLVVTPMALTFNATGGSVTLNVQSDDIWACGSNDSWLTMSPSGGTSGTTTVTVTADPYSSTTVDRNGTILFSTMPISPTLLTVSIRQKKVSQGGVQGVYLGDVPISEIYLGDIPIGALNLGDIPIF